MGFLGFFCFFCFVDNNLYVVEYEYVLTKSSCHMEKEGLARQ